ncbi:MAG: hypothetical protein HZB61_10285 [Nitrospirae bacterium]|nr:hypothetical protein [Nitrospirota bacterium]
MSTEDLIKQGLIGQRKQARMRAVIDGKAALQALLNEAVSSKIKPLEEINVDSLQSHLDQLKAKKKECLQLVAEIKELE